jgi:hypothetical protein
MDSLSCQRAGAQSAEYQRVSPQTKGSGHIGWDSHGSPLSSNRTGSSGGYLRVPPPAKGRGPNLRNTDGAPQRQEGRGPFGGIRSDASLNGVTQSVRRGALGLVSLAFLYSRFLPFALRAMAVTPGVSFILCFGSLARALHFAAGRPSWSQPLFATRFVRPFRTERDEPSRESIVSAEFSTERHRFVERRNLRAISAVLLS